MDKELVGLGAYLCISAEGRIVKDSQEAPTLQQEVALARIASGAWRAYEYLEKRASDANLDIYALMEPSHGLIGQLESRLRPSGWWDRVAKTYVSVGVMVDTWCLLAERLDQGQLITDELRNAWGHTEWARNLIAQGDDSDPTLAPRLSLWGRRVVGDVMSTTIAAVSCYPGLKAVLDTDREGITAQVMAAHSERMKAAGLKG